jgi:predicted DNA-binding transcriptional regulator AlpA
MQTRHATSAAHTSKPGETPTVVEPKFRVPESRLTLPEPPVFIFLEGLRALGIRMSTSTLRRLEVNGRFPKRVRHAAHSICWLLQEVLAWIEARKAERAGWHYGDPSDPGPQGPQG